MTPRLDNWSMERSGGPYTAPELCGYVLVGTVTGSIRFQDGDRIQTSQIAREEGTTVFTASGAAYELGEPKEEWQQWLESQGKGRFVVGQSKLLKTP